jgi:GTPase
MLIKNEDDVVSAAANFKSDSVAPIFTVSNVTGEHLDLVFKFFNFVPPVQTRVEQEKLEQEKPEFQVDETFLVPSAGTVVGGKMLRYYVTQFACMPEINQSFDSFKDPHAMLLLGV